MSTVLPRTHWLPVIWTETPPALDDAFLVPFVNPVDAKYYYSTMADLGAFLAAVGTYGTEDAQDDIATLIQNGTGITWFYDDGANTLTPTVTITQYTDGMADVRVAAGIATHEAAVDPHPQYLTAAEGAAAFDALGAAAAAVTAHEGLSDPHPGYLTPAEGNAAYEVVGAVAAHVALPDPHTQYLKESDFNLSAFTTTDLAEGANLYFTNQRASNAALPNTLMLMGA